MNNEMQLSQHEQAVQLHQRIMTSGSLAAQNLWEMANALKEMRDGKLYKELGYQNFESYCEEEVGFSREQGRKYISIIENMKQENANSSWHLGVTKLYLLSSLSEDKQQEISETVDLESVSVRELKKEIEKLKADVMSEKRELFAANTKVNALSETLGKVQMKANEAKAENVRLEKENRELKSRPVEVAVVDNSDSERRLKETIKALEAENIRQNELMDKRYIEDRRKLEADKAAEIEAIRTEYEQKLKDAAAEAQPEDKDKQEFKVFLVMAHDALTRLVAVANTHSSEPVYANKVKELLSSANKMLEE